jgi:spermidine/putrescine transport system substrate-binding protein
MLRPEVGQKVVEELGYSTPNTAAQALLSETLRNNPVIFPPADVMSKAEFQNDVGDATKIYDGYWEKLKTGK